MVTGGAVSTKGIRCPHCWREIWLSIYAVEYYCVCGRKLEVKKCKKVPARPTKKDKVEMERGRRFFIMHCLYLAATEEKEFKGEESLVSLAVQYGGSAKITRKECEDVLKMTVGEVLVEEA